MTEPARPPTGEGIPPLLGSWQRLYAVVLGELLLCILGFWLFSRAFS
jgi:hypothetical protein